MLLFFEQHKTIQLVFFQQDNLVIYIISNLLYLFNGKMRFKLELPMNYSKEQIEEAVMSHEKTQTQLQGRTPKKIIIVPGKIVNIVG